MNTTIDVAIIGAGPYGLSLAAHLSAANLDIRVFGEPMRFWRDHMPEGMVLKSEGFASTFWDPQSALTLEKYCAQHGLPYQHSGLPVPLKTFCEYGLAFQKRFVPMLDERRVANLSRDGKGFALQLQDGATMFAKRVVLTTGIGNYSYVPAELETIRGPLLSHSVEVRPLDRFVGKKVLIVGGGASGVELAALMSARGTDVTVAMRRAQIPFCGAPAPRSLLDKIQAPESGLGTGWRSTACAMAPMVFYAMPQSFRHLVVRKHLGPAPGWTSRAEVERNVGILARSAPVHAAIRDNRAVVTFVTEGGAKRLVEADHVISATGFRPDIRRLPFLGQDIRDSLKLEVSTPVLSPHFETSIPGLFTIGVLAANSFGPLLRFVFGAGFASSRLSHHLVKTASRQVVRQPAALAHA